MLSTLNLVSHTTVLQRIVFNRPATTVQQQQENTAAAAAEARKKMILKIQSKFLTACGYGGIGMASLLGANSGRKAGMTAVGCGVMGFISGTGGGTMRDILQGKRVYWLEKPIYAWWSLGMSMIGAFCWDGIKRTFGISEKDKWALAVSLCSLGGCACSGAAAGLAQGGAGVVAQPIRGAIYAMFCAVGGGVVRDYMLGRRPAVLYPEGWANVFPSAAGAIAYQAAHTARLPPPFVAASGFFSSIALRMWLTKRFAAKTAAKAAAAATAAAQKK